MTSYRTLWVKWLRNWGLPWRKRKERFQFSASFCENCVILITTNCQRKWRYYSKEYTPFDFQSGISWKVCPKITDLTLLMEINKLFNTDKEASRGSISNILTNRNYSLEWRPMFENATVLLIIINLQTLKYQNKISKSYWSFLKSISVIVNV